jgi:hypothetical protein
MTLAADFVAQLRLHFVDWVLDRLSDKPVLLIPVDPRKSHRAGSIPVRMSAELKRSPSVRPWPLCRVDRD